MQNIGQANLIGMTAHELLTRPDFSAHVIAVVSHAVYLETRFLPFGENGLREILWLVQSHVPMHPRAILGAFDFAGWRVGMELRDKLAQNFANAPIWSPPPIAREKIAPREMVMARMKDLEGSLARKPSRSDLRDLIGLGEGLTPAGDDFVGGVLFARWHLHAAYPAESNWDQRGVDELIEYARPRTNAISFALLRDHARGHSVAPLYDLLNALIENKSPNEMAHPIRRLLAIGNTSGREMLAGLLHGILTLNF